MFAAPPLFLKLNCERQRKMQYYSLKLRLSGNPMNEVRNVYSAPEVLILQYIHGVEAVSEIKKVKEERMNLREFKEHLKGKYDQALMRREQSIDKIFGALGQLPTKLPENLLEQFDMIDEEDIVAVAKSVTKSDKKSFQLKSQTEQKNLDRLVPQEEVDMSDIME